jgi:hypothetical protein
MAILNDLGTIYKGEDVSLNFTMSPVVNITGWTITFTVRKESLTGSVILTSDGTVVSGPSGTFSVPIAAAQTSGVKPGEYAWDVWRVDVDSAALIAYGDITISGSPRIP